MKRVEIKLQETVQADLGERLIAARQVKKVAKMGRWMRKISPRCGFEKGKQYRV